MSQEIHALYERLSRDDDAQGDSNSIVNQKKLLEKFAADRGLKKTRHYFDDGFSGTNFNRPGFQKLLKDIEAGYVKTVIVKDMSRLGRDYLEVGMYTDKYFPDHGVRFIAMNDGVDSAEGDNEFAPFRNIMNEWYARDISRKIRSSQRLRGSAGEPLCTPPYGYKKDPDNPKRWLIDDEAAEVVRRIYQMCIDGHGIEQTAAILHKDGILKPIEYWKTKGVRKPGRQVTRTPCHWCSSTITKILTAREYCGDLVNFKTYTKSYKNKARVENSEENQLVFENNHQPIIEKAAWETVQRIRNKTKRRPPKEGPRNMFAGLLYCADCGSKLHYNVNHPSTHIGFFNCSNYRTSRGTCRQTHYIRTDSLEQIVLYDLSRLTRFVEKHEEEFVKLLIDKQLRDMQSENRRREDELAAVLSRNTELDTLFERIYEDNVSGKINDDRFMKMSRKYEAEQLELKSKIAMLQKEVKKEKRHSGDAGDFLDIVRKYIDVRELNPSIVNEMIEKIVVYQAEKVGKERIQRVEIYYNFIGLMELPEMDSIPQTSIQVDTRKGVSVRYTTGKAS